MAGKRFKVAIRFKDGSEEEIYLKEPPNITAYTYALSSNDVLQIEGVAGTILVKAEEIKLIRVSE